MTANVRFACPCCSKLTLHEAAPGTFDICPVCYWEDDDTQFNNPALDCGANEVSLKKARENYDAFGYSQEQYKSKVRVALPKERP